VISPPSGGTLARLQEQGQALFEAAPELVADGIREFLRG